MLSIRWIAWIFVSPAAGLAVTFLSRKQALILASGFSAVGTGLLGVAPDVVWLVGFMAIFGIGDALFTPVHRDTITMIASDDRRAGIISSMSVLC